MTKVTVHATIFTLLSLKASDPDISGDKLMCWLCYSLLVTWSLKALKYQLPTQRLIKPTLLLIEKKP